LLLLFVVSAENAHTDIVNALSTPNAAAVHDHAVISPSIVISRPEEFAMKRAEMIRAGSNKLNIIADFDRTISAFRCANGELCHASHQLLESCVGFDKTDFLPKMEKINEKYFALEVSPHVNTEQRAIYMLEWWHQAHELLLAQNIKKQSIDDAVARARQSGCLELRKGAHEFLKYLNQNDVPCLVFSAGLKETIAATLRAEQLDSLDNLHLIGNEMEFDSNGLLIKFGNDTITSSNKNYSHVHSMEPIFHTRSHQRRHVILLGDNIGDSNMAEGMDDIECIIRIGLLHDHVDARMEQFKEAFDIVLLNDADFSFVHQLVTDIVNGK
jgi:HAD superfamily hydrolase (TIGR01544 family)